MNKKYEDNDLIDSLIKNNDFKNLKETLGKMVDYSSKEISRIIRETRENKEEGLIPVKKQSLVEQKPRSIKSLKAAVMFSNIVMVGSGVFSVAYITEILGNISKHGILNIFSDLAILGLFLAPGVFAYIKARKNKFNIQLTNRFKKYILEFGNREVAKIPDLMRAAQVPREIVLMDIEELIERDYFKQASILDDKLVIDNKVYNDMKNMIQAEKNKPIEYSYINDLVLYERKMQEPIAGQIRELLGICEKIHTTEKEYPQGKETLSKFREYYLPTVIKLLKEYENIDKNTTDNKSEIAKKEIEETLTQINTAFKNILNDMYEDNLLDIKTDISVLKTLLISEGLLDEDLL